ncbi:MAG: DUF2851 family protein [Kiritimatiellae bacterium]|nr:DUF2851 family protein [Kiritimatiellia bacterium]
MNNLTGLDVSQYPFYPRSAAYRELLPNPRQRVEERSSRYGVFPYSERHLQCLWADKHWRPDLQTSVAEDVTVLSPGRWNLEAGPDFLDAVLLAGPDKRRIVGDVEIHIRPEDWEHHGHSNDPRYSRVIAHVTYFPGTIKTDTLPGGAMQIALRDPLRSDPEFSFENIDVTAYPYEVTRTELRACAQALNQADDPDAQATILMAAGEERLRIKSQRFQHIMAEQGEEQTLYMETMAALGYKHNRFPFRLLAMRVPVSQLQQMTCDADSAYALLAGVSGLLPEKLDSHWGADARAFVRRIWDTWWKQRNAWEHAIMDQTLWQSASIRPQNHPRRRLAAAAGLFGAKPDVFTRLTTLDTGDARNWFRQAKEILTEINAPAFWQHHLGLAGKRNATPVSVLGPSRAAAIVSNVFVPFLAATGKPIQHLLDHLPSQGGNAITRQTATILFGRDHNPALYRNGLREQGLIQIFHDFCIHLGATCEECPFPSSISARFPPPDHSVNVGQ